MDLSAKYWHLYRRNFPSKLKVHSFDFIPSKSHWCESEFLYPSFSFILAGSGEFRHGQRKWAVEAPCLLTEWPGGGVFEYGPPPGNTWTEFYIKFDPESFNALCDGRFIDCSRPVRPIHKISGVESQLKRLEELSNARAISGTVDWIDRACELAILAAFSPDPCAAHSDEADVFAQIENMVRSGITPDQNLDALVRQLGMSPRTFTRRCFEYPSNEPAPVPYTSQN